MFNLKDRICNQNNTTKIRPVSLSSCGFLESGNSSAVDYLLEKFMYVSRSDSNETAYKKKGIISQYELFATTPDRPDHPIIREITQESSLAFGVLSAFQGKLFISQPSVSDIDACSTSPANECFDDPELNQHLQHTLNSLIRESEASEDDSKTLNVTNTKDALPNSKGIALINIWKIFINKIIIHFFNAMSGHLYNTHAWLFFDMNDIESLDKPLPRQTNSEFEQQDDEVLAVWRPRLHYLLRAGRMCVDIGKKRTRVCTMFGKHHEPSQSEDVEKIVEQKVQQAAKHIGVSSLLEPKLKVVNLNGGEANDYSHHLYHKFLGIIYDTPYEDIPLSWVFLRSLFYQSAKVFIAKHELEKKASKCGIDNDSFDRFCRFFTSFGSIFDLSLINPNCQYVIVKPIEFLMNLNRLLYPDPSIIKNNDLVQQDIFHDKVCKQVYGEEDWSYYMDALESIGLAAKLQATRIKHKNISCDDTYYYIPYSVKNKLQTESDSNNIFVITSDDSYSVFKLTTIVKHILDKLKGAKLVPCEFVNQAIIEDRSGIITIIIRSPVTEINVSKPSASICSCIASIFEQISKSCDKGPAKYRFEKVCKRSEDPVAKANHAEYRHTLPDYDDCTHCGKDDLKLIEWKKAIKEVRQHDKILILYITHVELLNH